MTDIGIYSLPYLSFNFNRFVYFLQQLASIFKCSWTVITPRFYDFTTLTTHIFMYASFTFLSSKPRLDSTLPVVKSYIFTGGLRLDLDEYNRPWINPTCGKLDESANLVPSTLFGTHSTRKYLWTQSTGC